MKDTIVVYTAQAKANDRLALLVGMLIEGGCIRATGRTEQYVAYEGHERYIEQIDREQLKG